MAQRDLEELTRDQCLELLRAERVGRLVYLDADGPVAIPVNYAMAGDDIVFRVEGGAKQAAMSQPALAFEVDHVDDGERSGWSVLARGTGRQVPSDAVLGLIRRIDGPPPAPWAFGVHNVWLQLTPSALTGRRLGAPRLAPMY